MQYKTIVLELLRQRTGVARTATADAQAPADTGNLLTELKASHETWKQTLATANPGSDPSQIASEAMELAIKELEDRLPTDSTGRTIRSRSTRQWHRRSRTSRT